MIEHCYESFTELFKIDNRVYKRHPQDRLKTKAALYKLYDHLKIDYSDQQDAYKQLEEIISLI